MFSFSPTCGRRRRRCRCCLLLLWRWLEGDVCVVRAGGLVPGLVPLPHGEAARRVDPRAVLRPVAALHLADPDGAIFL